jgi:hypothetical protein
MAQDVIKIYSDKILELAPCSRDFTKSEVLHHLENSEIEEYEKYFNEIYSGLIQDGFLEQVPDKHPNWVRMTRKGVEKKFSGYDSEEFTINRILQELYDSPDKKKFYSDILDENQEAYNFNRGIDMSKILLYENLIIWSEGTEVWQLSPRGRRIVREGGWIECNESKKIKKNKEKNLKHLQHADAKFKYYSFWPLLIVALIGGIYSLIKISEFVRDNPIARICNPCP